MPQVTSEIRPPQARLAHCWRLLAAASCVLVALSWLLLHGVGQNHYLVAPLCYLPRVFAGWLLILLALPGWWWGRRWFWILLAGGFGYLTVLLGWRPPQPAAPPDPARPELRAAFVNWGDLNQSAWEAWVAREKPDLVALTDVRDHRSLGVGQPPVAGLPFVLRVGEHLLASRYPFSGAVVTKPAVASPPNTRLHALPAARFQVDVPGGPVVVYVVHLRSPRDALRKYGERKFWRWTWFGLPPRVHEGNTLDHYWREQGAMLTALLEKMRAETLPTLVLGDWNLPDFGPRYRALTRDFQDAHRVAGSGYGFTFPGDLTLAGAFNQPWMRIDYILADRRHWRVMECRVQEGAGDSQHRGLLARLQRE